MRYSVALRICYFSLPLWFCDNAAGQTSTGGFRPTTGDPFSSTVDWYKPLPPAFVRSKRVDIYADLIVAVPHRLHREAVALLGNADAVELTKEQAKHFGFRAEADSLLRAHIQDDMERLRRIQRRRAELKAGHDPHVSAREANQELQGRQFEVNKYTGEIKQYQAWVGRLKPYLTKAVTLASTPEVERSGFWGEVNSEDLAIVHSASGNQALPMKRMPLIIYLPAKPRHVYTGLSMLE